MKKRLSEMDILRGFCMLSVLILHTLRYANGLEPVFHYVSAFCVVSFYFVSGYFFSAKEEHVVKYIKKKAKQMLVPYAFSGILSICLYKIFIKRDYPFLTGIKALLIGNGANSDALIFNPPLWFLPAIFSITVLFYLMHRFLIELDKHIPLHPMIKNGTWLLPVFLISGYLFAEPMIGMQPFFGTGYIVGGGLFFELGYQIKINHIQLKQENAQRSLLFAGGVVCMILAFYADEPNIRTSCMNLRYGDYTLFLITGLFATYGMYLIASAIKSLHVMEVIGSNTINILIWHRLFITGYRRYLDLDAVINTVPSVPIRFLIYLTICFALCFLSIETPKVAKKMTSNLKTKVLSVYIPKPDRKEPAYAKSETQNC